MFKRHTEALFKKEGLDYIDLKPSVNIHWEYLKHHACYWEEFYYTISFVGN